MYYYLRFFLLLETMILLFFTLNMMYSGISSNNVIGFGKTNTLPRCLSSSKRFNGIFRDRELTFRGLKKSDMALIGGYQAFCNYTKKHMISSGKTPAESSNIKVA